MLALLLDLMCRSFVELTAVIPYMGAWVWVRILYRITCTDRRRHRRCGCPRCWCCHPQQPTQGDQGKLWSFVVCGLCTFDWYSSAAHAVHTCIPSPLGDLDLDRRERTHATCVHWHGRRSLDVATTTTTPRSISVLVTIVRVVQYICFLSHVYIDMYSWGEASSIGVWVRLSAC